MWSLAAACSGALSSVSCPLSSEVALHRHEERDHG